MPAVIAEHTMGSWTDEEVLLNCVKEYANPSNYEPYEKDYGVGRPIMRTPLFARDIHDHAKRTLQFLAERKEPGKLPAVATGNGSCLVPPAKPLSQRETAYVKMHMALNRVKNSPEWDSLPAALQDEINNAHKAGEKWI